jgi:hypothetical protein
MLRALVTMQPGHGCVLVTMQPGHGCALIATPRSSLPTKAPRLAASVAASRDVSDQLSGYTHNAVSPMGIATPDLPIIMSHAIPQLQPDFFFLGAGAPRTPGLVPLQRPCPTAPQPLSLAQPHTPTVPLQARSTSRWAPRQLSLWTSTGPWWWTSPTDGADAAHGGGHHRLTGPTPPMVVDITD